MAIGFISRDSSLRFALFRRTIPTPKEKALLWRDGEDFGEFKTKKDLRLQVFFIFIFNFYLKTVKDPHPNE